MTSRLPARQIFRVASLLYGGVLVAQRPPKRRSIHSPQEVRLAITLTWLATSSRLPKLNRLSDDCWSTGSSSFSNSRSGSPKRRTACSAHFGFRIHSIAK